MKNAIILKTFELQIEIGCHLWTPTDPNSIQISSSQQVLLFFVNVEPVTYSHAGQFISNLGRLWVNNISCSSPMLCLPHITHFACLVKNFEVSIYCIDVCLPHKSDSVDQNRCISHSSKSFPRSYSTRYCWRCSTRIRFPLNFGCSGVIAMPSLCVWNAVSSVERVSWILDIVVDYHWFVIYTEAQRMNWLPYVKLNLKASIVDNGATHMLILYSPISVVG